MLRAALGTPTRTDDAAGIFIVGTLVTLLAWTVTPVWVLLSVIFPPLLVLAPLALAPMLVARGYFVRVVADGIRDGNADGAPSFVSWGRLYRDGIKSVLLSVVLLIPLILVVVLAIAAGVVVGLDRVDPDPLVSEAAGVAVGDAAATDAIIGLFGGLVGVLSVGYLAAFAYVRPAALAAFASTGRFRDGLKLGTILRIGGSGEYAVGWTLAMVTLFAGYALAAPFIPLLVGIGLVFTIRLIAHALYGRGAASAITSSSDRQLKSRSDPTQSAVGSSVDSSRDAVDSGGHREANSEDQSGSQRQHTGKVTEPAPEAPASVQVGRGVPRWDSLSMSTDVESTDSAANTFSVVLPDENAPSTSASDRDFLSRIATRDEAGTDCVDAATGNTGAEETDTTKPAIMESAADDQSDANDQDSETVSSPPSTDDAFEWGPDSTDESSP